MENRRALTLASVAQTDRITGSNRGAQSPIARSGAVQTRGGSITLYECLIERRSGAASTSERECGFVLKNSPTRTRDRSILPAADGEARDYNEYIIMRTGVAASFGRGSRAGERVWLRACSGSRNYGAVTVVSSVTDCRNSGKAVCRNGFLQRVTPSWSMSRCMLPTF